MVSRLRSLSSEQIVRLWEIGQRQHPLDRALSCLTFALPDISWDALANLSIGQRDAYLLHLREQTFGPQLNSLATCPKCQEKLEFALTTTALQIIELADLPLPTPAEIHTYQTEGLSLQFRLPTSLDLAAVLSHSGPVVSRKKLAQRCLIQVQQAGQDLNLAEISETAIAALAQQLAVVDPQAEILLDLDCPACEHQWQILFDIVDFFWTELAAQAKRLLLDVHQLAQFYGWREADILSLSSLRRQYYLELVS